MNETYVTIRGRLTADPVTRTTRNGAPMTTFRIASSVRKPVQGQQGVWEDAGTSFYDVVTFKALAANAVVSLRKGNPVTIHGRQEVKTWKKDDGTTWWAIEVTADAVGHDLNYGTTAFARVGRGQEGDGFRPADPSGREGEAPPPEFSNPDTDPYRVEDPPGRGLGEVARPDTGPLVPTGDEAAA